MSFFPVNDRLKTMMKKAILFDLDGTLSDPKEGITRSVQYSLKKLSLPFKTQDELEIFIGPPLIHSYRDIFNLDEERSLLAVKYFREYFNETGKFENTLYTGIPELLAELKKKGYRLAVATSKPTLFAQQIISHFNLNSFFDSVTGSHLDNTRTDKKEIIQAVLTELGLSAEEAIMVGDRKYDILGARALGVNSAGVLYGYGSRQEMEEAAPDYTASTVEELSKILREL